MASYHCSYDPLAVHMTVPLILYENQRLDIRLKTLAVSGGRPNSLRRVWANKDASTFRANTAKTRRKKLAQSKSRMAK